MQANGQLGGLHYAPPLAVERRLEPEELRVQEPPDRRLGERERRPVERQLDAGVGDDRLGLLPPEGPVAPLISASTIVCQSSSQ
jgi:hypothetical protein